jgi:imidazolonepropionase-like amidohydrolase
MKAPICCAVLASILTGVVGTGAQRAHGESFAIRDVRVFDGEKTIVRSTVVVSGGRIVAFAPDAPIPRRFKIIEGGGKTLLPGLIDSHVHVFPGAQKDALRFGITTELDMFDLSHDFKAWRAQRESLAKTNQADTWAAGTGVTVKGGGPLQDLPPTIEVPTLASAADAKEFVDARVAEGSDYIKLFIENLSEYHSAKSLPTLSRDEVCAVIKSAHEDGRLTTTHAQAEWAAREAIECGTDGLAHMFPDQIADSDFIVSAKAHQIFIETTDVVWAGVAGLDLAKTLAADPRVALHLSAAQKQSLLIGNKNPHPDFFSNALENTRLLHEAGIVLLAGTDAPNPGTAHGVSLHGELQILVRAGFPPEQALNAATALPARVFHLRDRGRIAVGLRADLVLINGDPTQTISDTLSIARIWKNGYAIDRTVR